MLSPCALALLAAWSYADAERPHRPAPASAPASPEPFPARRLPASFLPGPIDLAALVKPAPSSPPAAPGPPAWWTAEGREGVEVYGRKGADGVVAVEHWRFAGTTESHAGRLPPNVGLRWWYRLAGHPGVEGYGLIGPAGVRVEKWRFLGTTSEYAGTPAIAWPPSAAPLVVCPPGGS